MRYLALTAALSALLLIPAAADAKTKTHTTNYAYRVTKAQGSETATFQGDGTQTCASEGLCGYSGTASWTFSNPSGGQAIVTVQTRKGHKATGFGSFGFGIDGTTSSNVAEAGVAQPCVDSIKHNFDTLDVIVSSSRVLFGLHAANADLLKSDYLGTHCAGPTEEDMVTARALPGVVLPISALKRHRLDFGLHTNVPFHVGPFTGTLKVDADYTIVRDRKTERRLNKKG